MIHNVTIPFMFDTSPIEKQIEAIGESEASKVVRQVVLEGLHKALPSKYNPYSSGVKNDYEIDWKAFASRYMEDWVEKHHQEIVDEAAILLAMKASRKKPWREVLKELRESGELDG